MKTIIIHLLFVCSCFASYGQKLEVNFKAYNQFNLDTLEGKPNSEQLKYQITKLKKDLSEIDYILKIKDNIAIFETVDKLQLPNRKNYLALLEKNQKYYTDTKESIEQTIVLNEKVLIAEKSYQRNWKILNSKKDILGYECFKGVLENPDDDKIIEVWFTKELPLSFGPKGYHGLPGLILELKQNENLVYKAINIKEKENIFIEKPSGGRQISRDEQRSKLQSHINSMQKASKN